MMHNYLLFDSARAEINLYKAKELNPVNQSLYKGRAAEDLDAVAPYLFDSRENAPFVEWYLKTGWGKSWGILLYAETTFEKVYKHFRNFLLVRTEDRQQLYFRFYDPRVLTMFLPSCDSDQILEFFGPVEYFIAEDASKMEAVQFWHRNGMLKQKKISTKELFGTIPENIV